VKVISQHIAVRNFNTEPIYYDTIWKWFWIDG